MPTFVIYQHLPIMKGRVSQVLIHITGYVIVLALPIVFSPDANNLSDLWKYPPALKDFLVYLALLLFFYFNYFWLIPHCYFQRKYLAFFLISPGCFTLIVLVPNMLIGFKGGPPRNGYDELATVTANATTVGYDLTYTIYISAQITGEHLL